MIKSSIEQLAEPIGFDIGASDNKTQANLLNGFCRALLITIANSHSRSMQIAYIYENLTDDSKKILKEIGKFIEESEEK